MRDIVVIAGIIELSGRAMTFVSYWRVENAHANA